MASPDGLNVAEAVGYERPRCVGSINNSLASHATCQVDGQASLIKGKTRGSDPCEAASRNHKRDPTAKDIIVGNATLARGKITGDKDVQTLGRSKRAGYICREMDLPPSDSE